MNSRKSSLVVLITHPIQYYAPLYKLLSSKNNIDLHVVFLSDAGATAYHDPGFGTSLTWDVPLLEGYSYTILERGLSLDGIGFWARYSPKLEPLLNQLSPDFMLVYGYASRMNWVAQQWAVKRGRKVIYTSDSNFNNPRNSIKNILKGVLVARFFRDIDVFLSPSEANEKYLVQFKAKKDSIIRCPFAIDYERWSSGSPEAAANRTYQFVWAGKLIARKRPLDFIEALWRVSQQIDGGIDALLIGDGPARSYVEQAVEGLPASCRVKIFGFVNQQDMPNALGQAHTFVFTSENEPYGLIATEAAAAGLSLIVADKIGCVGDTVLARPGVNTLTYPAGDVEALAKAMLKLIDEADMRTRMQQASLEIAEGHDISAAAKILEDVILQRYPRAICTGKSTDEPS